MKITEEAKIKIFAMKSVARMYAQTDEDFGRFCRGFYHGVLTVLAYLDVTDILPMICPDDAHTSYASFCSVYAAYLNAERAPRLPKDNADYIMMYGEQAQAMMKEAERHLATYKKQKAGRDN